MALEGKLQDMSLVDLIQVFQMGPKTGVLVLVNGGERGVVYVSAGRLVDAVLVRGPERRVLATDEEAVIQLLQWDDASFVFRHDPSAAARAARIAHDGEWLVMEGVRRRACPQRAAITLDSRLELAALPTSAEASVKLDLDQWRILSQVAASRDVREICQKTGMSPEAAVRTVGQLVAVGLVDVAPPRQAGGPEQRRPPRPGVAVGSGLLQAIMRRVRGL